MNSPCELEILTDEFARFENQRLPEEGIISLRSAAKALHSLTLLITEGDFPVFGLTANSTAYSSAVKSKFGLCCSWGQKREETKVGATRGAFAGRRGCRTRKISRERGSQSQAPTCTSETSRSNRQDAKRPCSDEEGSCWRRHQIQYSLQDIAQVRGQYSTGTTPITGPLLHGEFAMRQYLVWCISTVLWMYTRHPLSTLLMLRIWCMLSEWAKDCCELDAVISGSYVKREEVFCIPLKSNAV